MMTLYDWLDKRDALRKEYDNLRTAVMLTGLISGQELERLEWVKKELAKAEAEIDDRTR